MKNSFAVKYRFKRQVCNKFEENHEDTGSKSVVLNCLMSAVIISVIHAEKQKSSSVVWECQCRTWSDCLSKRSPSLIEEDLKGELQCINLLLQRWMLYRSSVLQKPKVKKWYSLLPPQGVRLRVLYTRHWYRPECLTPTESGPLGSVLLWMTVSDDVVWVYLSNKRRGHCKSIHSYSEWSPLSYDETVLFWC